MGDVKRRFLFGLLLFVPELPKELLLGIFRRLRFNRQMRIERQQQIVIRAALQEGQGLQELQGLRRKGLDGGVQDVIAFLDEIERAEIEAVTAAGGVQASDRSRRAPACSR